MEKESGSEKVFRFVRNVNILGALAIGGAALLIPGPNVVLASLVGIDVAQAAGFEALRRRKKSKSKKKSDE